MTSTDPEAPRPPRTGRQRVVRLRTLLIWLAVVPTVAMGLQVAVSADRLMQQSANLRAQVAAGQLAGKPLYKLMVAMQRERATTAASWAGSAVSRAELRTKRAATDRAEAAFHRAADHGLRESGQADDHLHMVEDRLDDLDAYRERADARRGGVDRTIGYYTGTIGHIIRVYEALSHMDDAELTRAARPVVAMFSASEVLAQEDTILSTAGPGKQLTRSAFGAFTNAIGAHRFFYDTWIVPYLPDDDRKFLRAIIDSDAWKTKTRIESAVISDHQDTRTGVELPQQVESWPVVYHTFAAELDNLNVVELDEVLTDADAKADQLDEQVAWLIGGSAVALLVVVAVVVFTTRTVLRRMDRLHKNTVTIAEQTLPDVVSRLRQGRPVDVGTLPEPRGERDEVGRISDAFARAVAVSIDGHRQLADERQGFGMFAAGIASRTGNLVSRQLSLTEDLQDTFGHDEALLAQLMRSDQLTVGMRRQIENLLILAGGEIPDPHTEPMRVADLLREAASEVEDFRRIDRHAMDEVSVEPRVISQISHLLAELLDNATRFSPPASKVIIRSELVSDGLSVEVEDRGPRVAPERYEEMNGRLHSASYAVLAENAHRLGLFVVGHLADQLGAKVTLRRSVFGGTSAVVVIPEEHLVKTEQPAAPEPAPTPPAPRRPEESEPEHGSKPEHESKPVRSAAPAGPAPTGTKLPRRQRTKTKVDQAKPADRPSRPPLPERVPQSHLAEQLREPRAVHHMGEDTATPEEVADAWADYEDGTEKVEAELRRDQP